MNIIDEDIVHIVFEDGGLVYSRKVAAMARGALDKPRWVPRDKTYPLVKTFSSEVLPQAPSPLLKISVNELAVIEGDETVQQDKLAMNRLAPSAERHGG